MGRISDAHERLLRAALELIWSQNYFSVGVDAICVRAGVKKGSFYHFFSSKADLAAAAVQDHWDRYRPEMEAVFDPARPPLERLALYFERTYQFQIRRREKGGHVTGCPYFDLGAEAATLEPGIMKQVQRILDEYFAYFAAAVADAHAAGTVAVEDPQAAARWLFSFFEGALTHARICNDPELLRDLGEGALQLLGVTLRRGAA